MHKSSMLRMEWFIQNYVKTFEGAMILDVGSYDVNGSYKRLLEDLDVEYIGLDIEKGPNVDIVVDNIYNWDILKDNSFDFIISGQAFEHIEYPWLTIQEIYKKLKPEGITCIIAPSTIEEHRYPKDCYRYYGDGLKALAKWAGLEVIETSVAGIPNRYVSGEWNDRSNDACLIAYKKPDSNLGKAQKFNDKIIFQAERRYHAVYDLKMQYEFLAMLYENAEACNLIIRFINENSVKKVYIYGYDHVGKYFSNKLREKTNVTVEVIQTEGIMASIESGSLAGIDTEAIKEVNNTAFYGQVKKEELIIITEFDYYRDYVNYLQKKLGTNNIYYAYDLIDLQLLNEMRGNNNYIFGAGNNGKSIYKRIRQLGFDISGFIVSDGHKTNASYCEKPVFEIHEIDTESYIIISNEKSQEILEMLENMHYSKIMDGKNLINIWKYTVNSV